MTDLNSGYVLNDWFRCPQCAEPAKDGYLTVTYSFGLGNVSLNVSCSWCMQYSHTARDWVNQNLRPGLSRRRWFKQEFLTHPLLGSELHSALQCAACSARGHVEAELELVEEGEYDARHQFGILRLHCRDCGERYESRISH